jgi:hypothetical protein
VDALVIIEALFLSVVALFTLSFVLSCIWEREGRAALIGGVTFLILLGAEAVLFALRAAGFFQSTAGLLILLVGLAISLTVLLLLVRFGRNPRAQQGTKGYIVGEVKRFDEREQVFSRGFLPPGSEQYQAFYGKYPELEEPDGRRREMGIPMGLPGSIDTPHAGPNVAALFASLSIPHHLGNPHAVQPEASPFFDGKRMALSPEDATDRVKGLALSLGADLVGIAGINPSGFTPQGATLRTTTGSGGEVKSNYPTPLPSPLPLRCQGTWYGLHLIRRPWLRAVSHTPKWPSSLQKSRPSWPTSGFPRRPIIFSTMTCSLFRWRWMRDWERSVALDS